MTRDDSLEDAFGRMLAFLYDTLEDASVEWIDVKPWWWDEDKARVEAALKVLDARRG